MKRKKMTQKKRSVWEQNEVEEEKETYCDAAGRALR